MQTRKKIYEIALARLGVRAKETVFIDDREDFVAGAKKMGMETILFASLGQARNELARLLVGATDRERAPHRDLGGRGARKL